MKEYGDSNHAPAHDPEAGSNPGQPVRRVSRPQVLDGLLQAQHAVVDASAGTGKTFLLEHALIHLVLEGVPLPEILVVTYTERAAMELRVRVRGLLERVLASEGDAPSDEAAWTIGPRERARLLQARAHFDVATISTIHGFCYRVLSEHFFLLGRPERMELVDSATAFRAAFLEALRRDFAPASASLHDELLAWLRHRGVNQLEHLLSRVHHVHAPVRPELDSAALFAGATDLVAAFADPEALRAALEASSVNRSTVNATLRRFEALEEVVARWRRSPPGVLDLHADPGLASAATYLLGPARRRLAGLDELQPLLTALEALRAVQVPLDAAAAQLFLPAVRQRLDAHKQVQGTYDFDDLLRVLADALRPGAEHRAALCAAVRARWSVALIDEFQDTDPHQWSIFQELFVRDAEAHRLCVIGDAKQAIYGFRGADFFVYRAARRLLIHEAAATASLTTTYRSTPGLVAALNVLFDPEAGRPFFSGEPTYELARSARPGACVRDGLGSERAPVVLFRAEGEGWRADELRARHAEAIAHELRRLLGGGLVLEPPRDEPADETPVERSTLRARDCTVLCRSGAEAIQVAEALRAAGVPSAFYKQDGLLQTREAEDFLRVLEGIAEPQRKARRLRAFNTAFGGVELADVERCAELPGDHPLMERLLRWHRMAERQDFAALFRSLLEESGLVERELLLRRSERELTNYLHLSELLLETASGERLELRELIERLAAWISLGHVPGGEESSLQRQDGTPDAVQLLTIHKSKGLEAEVVFLFGGISAPRDQAMYLYRPFRPGPEDPVLVRYWDPHLEQRLVHVGPLTDEVAGFVRAEEEQEARRLLYVALTRARARLYLLDVARAPKGWAYGYLGGGALHLATRLSDLREAEALAPELFETRLLDRTPRSAGDDLPALRAACAGWRPPRDDVVLPGPDFDVLRAACAPRVRLSFSRIQRERREAEAEQPRAELDPEVSPPTALTELADLSPPPGASSGTALHELIEDLDWEALRSDDVEAWAKANTALAADALTRQGVSREHAPACLELSRAALTTPLRWQSLDLPQGLCASEHGVRELDFTYPLPGAPGALLRAGPVRVERGFVVGAIDYLFLADGRGYLADWKSNALEDYEPARLDRVVEEDYALQRDLYALALVKLLQITSEAEHEERFGGVLYVFLRGSDAATPNAGVSFARPSWSQICALEASLTELGVSGAPAGAGAAPAGGAS